MSSDLLSIGKSGTMAARVALDVTAQNIARQVGLRPLEAVITGTELEDLADASLQEHVGQASIFARVRPELTIAKIDRTVLHAQQPRILIELGHAHGDPRFRLS